MNGPISDLVRPVTGQFANAARSICELCIEHRSVRRSARSAGRWRGSTTALLIARSRVLQHFLRLIIHVCVRSSVHQGEAWSRCGRRRPPAAAAARTCMTQAAIHTDPLHATSAQRCISQQPRTRTSRRQGNNTHTITPLQTLPASPQL